MKKPLAVCLLSLAARLCAQQPAAPTELLGQPFYVKTIWRIEGNGNWDFIKMDPAYRRLFIAHGNKVQAVDIESGLVDGVIRGTRNARAIALDDREEFGYISGGGANEVDAFDRRALKLVARIPTGPFPRALVYEPTTQLLFAICSYLPGTSKTPGNGMPLTAPGLAGDNSTANSYPPGSYVEPKTEIYYVKTKSGIVPHIRPVKPPDPNAPPPESSVTVIDAETWTPLATILLRGRAGFAEADGQGRVFINIVDQNAIVRLEAQGIRDLLDEKRPIAKEELKHGKNRFTAFPDGEAQPLYWSNPSLFQDLASRVVLLDWRNFSEETRPPGDLWRTLVLGKECNQPQSLSTDGPRLRLFVACSDAKLGVVNADTGDIVAKPPTGADTGVLEFDAARNLLFAANGSGTLTVIRQHVTDSYQVVQNLNTSRHARVLAVNPSNGEVYVVTDSGESGLAVLVVGH